jgi:L-amino acid N-acyltransferase YncA
MVEADSALSVIRDASEPDGAACSQIYRPYVTDTVITFEAHPPDRAVMADRIERVQRDHAWLVLEDVGRVVGYAYGQPHKERVAYRWACEVSVYLETGRRRTGAGRLLYQALFARLAERGYLIALAGITQPNEASIGLHRALGFEQVGTYRRIGWKHGAWHDVSWWQCELAELGCPPDEPR